MLNIGQQIKLLREEKRLTGKDLASRIGLSQSQMSRLEKGQRRVDTEILSRIADALEVSPARFFGPGDGADGDGDDIAPLTARRERELSLARLHTEVGKLIRSERRQRHLTVDDLARRTGHTKAYVVAVEEGRRNGLSEDFLKKACRVLAIEPFTLVEMQERIIRDLKTRVHRLDLAVATGVRRSTEGPSEDAAGSFATPILVGDESVYPSEFSGDGDLVAAVEGYLAIPDLAGRPTFAVRVAGNEMTGPGTPSFGEGELVVFATDRSARSGEYAFVRFGSDETTFRRLFHDEGSVIRLHAVHPEIAPILLPLENLKSAWPLIAHVQVTS